MYGHMWIYVQVSDLADKLHAESLRSEALVVKQVQLESELAQARHEHVTAANSFVEQLAQQKDALGRKHEGELRELRLEHKQQQVELDLSSRHEVSLSFFDWNKPS